MSENQNENPFISAMEQGKAETKPIEQKALEAQTFEVNPSAEGIVNVIALINLLIGIFVFLILMVVAVSEEEWLYFGIGSAALLIGIIEWAFLKVFVNISRSLYNISTTIKEIKNGLR